MARSVRQVLGLSWDVLEPGDLASRSAEWDQLVADAGYPAFMQSGFLIRAILGFGCERGRLVLGHKRGRVVVGGIVMPTARGQWSTYQPSQLPLGAWLMSPDCNWHDASRSLLQVLPGFAISLGVTQQDPRLVPRPKARADCEVLDYVATGWIDVAGSFEEYWSARGRNLRQNLPRLRRRLEERGGRLLFEFLDQPDAVESAFLQFAALESASWKAEGGTAISASNQQGAFYRDMLRDLAGRGAAFAIRLTLGGQPIAVDFGVRDEETIVLLKTTYDENLKAYSPGQLLHEQAFAYVFQQRRVERIEFYGKLMEYETRWTDQSRMLFHVNFYRSPLLRAARDLLKLTRRRALQTPTQLAGG